MLLFRVGIRCRGREPQGRQHAALVLYQSRVRLAAWTHSEGEHKPMRGDPELALSGSGAPNVAKALKSTRLGTKDKRDASKPIRVLATLG